MALLNVIELKSYFLEGPEPLKAVDGVSFALDKGKTLGIVGESGCGKTTLALSLLRLVPPPGDIIQGDIQFEGKSIMDMTQDEMRELRGRDISMIFQEPMSSLNPVLTIGEQILEVILTHTHLDSLEAKRLAIEYLKKVHIPHAEARYNTYPHQLSGGMRQRVMIAMASVLKPKLLIADEPTTALDVTVQKEILQLLKEMIDELNMSLILVTHDFGVAASICDFIAVMYAGKVVEYSTCNEIFYNPLHPYTKGLLKSVVRLDHKEEMLSGLNYQGSKEPGVLKEVTTGHFIRKTNGKR